MGWRGLGIISGEGIGGHGNVEMRFWGGWRMRDRGFLVLVSLDEGHSAGSKRLSSWATRTQGIKNYKKGRFVEKVLFYNLGLQEF